MWLGLDYVEESGIFRRSWDGSERHGRGSFWFLNKYYRENWMYGRVTGGARQCKRVWRQVLGLVWPRRFILVDLIVCFRDLVNRSF